MRPDALYMDCLATTPVDPRVLRAMLPFFTERFGNAASRTHSFGTEAAAAVEEARAALAGLIGAAPEELVFTSGATEALNLALKGAAEMYAPRGRHLVVSAVEHRAVLDTCAWLESGGFEVELVPPDGEGRVDPSRFAERLRDDTILACLMWANNETGALQPVAEVGRACRERGVLLLSDGAQAVGKVPVDVGAVPVDLLAVSAHKFHGPKGVGALYVRRRDPRVRLAPLLHGGGHERGLRSGTADVPGIVGLGAAATIARDEEAAEAERVGALRDRLERLLSERLEGVRRNGPAEGRLPGCANLSFAGVDAEDLLARLGDRLAVSSGSACSSADLEPSHVLRAMGLPAERVASSVRFGLGRIHGPEDVERAVALVVEAVGAQRAARAPGGREGGAGRPPEALPDDALQGRAPRGR